MGNPAQQQRNNSNSNSNSNSNRATGDRPRFSRRGNRGLSPVVGNAPTGRGVGYGNSVFNVDMSFDPNVGHSNIVQRAFLNYGDQIDAVMGR